MHIYSILRQGTVSLCLGVSLQVVAQSASVSNRPILVENRFQQVDTPSTLSLPGVLELLEQKFQVSFFYKGDALKSKTVAASVLNYNSLTSALYGITLETGLQFEQTGKSVYTIIDKKAKADPMTSSGTGTNQVDSVSKSVALAPITVKGVILDEEGKPIPGAAIIVVGTQRGTTTGLDGTFSIEAEDTDILQIRYVGYESQDVAIAGRASVSVSMKPKMNEAKEVVVVGYGTKTKREVSSAIGSVTAKEVTATPVADAAQALQGRVAGLTVIQNSGAPGGSGGTSIRIRGISSVTGSNNPLVVLDGFPLPDQTADNVLNSLSPNEIESIDVLKDAAAASIYGVRGSNGVVIINTKRGKEGKTNISLDYYRGIQNVWNLPTMLNAEEYAIINSEARLASGLPPLSKLADPAAVKTQFGEGTDWLDQIFRAAAMTNVSLNVSGGTDKMKYALSGSYYNQDGIVKGTSFDRFNFRFNGDAQVSKKLKVGNSIILSRTTEIPKNTYDPFNSLLLLAVAAPPTVSVRNPDGSWAGGNGGEDGYNEPNPVYDIYVPQTKNTKFRSVGSIFGEYELLKGLTFRANLGMDFVMQNIRIWNPATPSSGGRPISITGFQDQINYSPSYLAEYTANYKFNIKDHNITALAGYTAQDNNYHTLGAGRNGYTRLDLQVLDDAATVPQTVSQTFNYGGYGTNRLISYVGRVSYDFKGKYLFSGSLRRDGSSNFGPGNKYAVFPAFSVGWNVIDEDFMQSIRQVSNLKIRASFGQTGNQNVPAFAYLQRINTGIQYPLGNNSGAGGANTGAAPTSTKNPDLKWEKNEQMNLGIDVGVFSNRVSASVDFYKRSSKDLIFLVSPPTTSGTYESTPLNTGTMTNTGIDLTLNTINLPATSKLKWNSTLIFSKFKNEVTDLGQSAPIFSTFSRITGGGLRVDEGLPVNYFYGYVAEGIFQTQEEIAAHAVQTAGTDGINGTSPGDIKFKDINGDGIINDKDRTNLGNSVPNFTYGFTNTISYDIFELSVFLQGSSGNKALNFTRWYTEGGVSNGNYSAEVLNRWTGPGTSNEMPRMTQADPNQNNRVSSRFIEDASYLRVKNIRFTVSLPNKWNKATTASKIRFYGSVQNAFTFTKYTGFDPEVGGGVDIGFYPQARTWLGGITVDF